MHMKRFIFRYRGKGETPAADVERISALPNAKVIDRSSRMFLLETQDDAAPLCEGELCDWAVSPEVVTPLPSPRPRIKKTL